MELVFSSLLSKHELRVHLFSRLDKNLSFCLTFTAKPFKELDDHVDNHWRKLKPITRSTCSSYHSQEPDFHCLVGSKWSAHSRLPSARRCLKNVTSFHGCLLGYWPWPLFFWSVPCPCYFLTPGLSPRSSPLLYRGWCCNCFSSEQIFLLRAFVGGGKVGRHTCAGRTDGAGPRAAFLNFFFGEFETYLSVGCTVSYLQFLASFGI